MSKVLFILKRRQDYNSTHHSHIGLSTGLYNSAAYMKDMLVDAGVDSKIAVVVDNNGIDREVHQYKPTHVIIEALWVVPTKFNILCKLHPTVKWIIRLHSETPFLANEGIAFDWLAEYATFKNISIAVNAPRILEELRDYLGTGQGWDEKERQARVIYLPNFYPQVYKLKFFSKNKEYIDIGCFGAIRPMKNHITQALAAIKFADKIGKKLRFHINIGRVEQRGDTVLNNLKAIFFHLTDKGHQLVGHKWMPREEFIELCSKMDIGLQVSFSETFNIVGADLVTQGAPLVCSPELPWSAKLFTANPVDSISIYKKLLLTYRFPLINNISNQYNLYRYTNKTRKIWVNYFTDEKSRTGHEKPKAEETV